MLDPAAGGGASPAADAFAAAGVTAVQCAAWLRALLPPDPESASPLHGRGVHVTTLLGSDVACPLCGAAVSGNEYHVELPEGPPGNAVPHPYWQTTEELLGGPGVAADSLMGQFAAGFRERAARTTIVAGGLPHRLEAHGDAGGGEPGGLTVGWLASLRRWLPPSRPRRMLPIA